MTSIEAVVKLGGSLLRHPPLHAAALQAVAAVASSDRLVIVPGGGPFADTVRALDGQLSIGDDIAHWLAIRAMDAHAELASARLTDGMLVESPAAIHMALDTDRIPVLAPSRWLRERDPLPHSWDVTSDSIAAWVAGELCSPRVVLLKAVGGTIISLADRWFPRVLPATVSASVCPITSADAGDITRRLLALLRPD